MSIRLRLAALFTLGAILLIAAGGFIYVRQLRTGLDHSLDQNLQARASAISATLVTRPTVRLPRALDRYVQVFDAEGRVLDGGPVLRGDRLLTAVEVRAIALHGTAVRLDRTIDLHLQDDGGPEPMRVYGGRVGRDRLVIAIAASHDSIDAAVSRSERQLLIFGAIVIALAAPGSWLLARGALRPVERMRTQVARLQAADVGAGVPVPHTRDEIARLGRTFNELLDRLHTALVRERSFVADAGHELRTPLTVLKGEFELAQRPGRSRAELVQTVDVAAEETDRLVRLTENLLVLAREGKPVEVGPVDLFDLAHAAAASVGAAAATRQVVVTIRDEQSGVVAANPDQLRRAVDNLLTNAIRYCPPGGTVSVRLARDGAHAVVTVSDDGPGFASGFLPRAFERFARADDARSRGEGGSGLGLAIVAQIMAQHDGIATATNRPGAGAVVTLRWPHTPSDQESSSR